MGLWDYHRFARSLAAASRWLIAGAAGALTFQIIRTNSPIVAESVTLLLLLLVTTGIEYFLRGVEPSPVEEGVSRKYENLQSGVNSTARKNTMEEGSGKCGSEAEPEIESTSNESNTPL
jgi:hypothetical protein